MTHVKLLIKNCIQDIKDECPLLLITKYIYIYIIIIIDGDVVLIPCIIEQCLLF